MKLNTFVGMALVSSSVCGTIGSAQAATKSELLAVVEAAQAKSDDVYSIFESDSMTCAATVACRVFDVEAFDRKGFTLKFQVTTIRPLTTEGKVIAKILE